MDEQAVNLYLQRIGADRPDGATAESLRRLHAAHLFAVPFENLSIHLGQPILLDEASLLDKIVGRKRGGFCYELNGAFGLLLSALGYDVALLAARVFGDDGVGPLFDHLVLRVATPAFWLVDVGFGEHSLHPLRLEPDVNQVDPRGTFVVTGAAHGDVDVAKDGQRPVPHRAARAGARRLRDDVLVASDLAEVTLHALAHLLAADGHRPGHAQRPEADPNRRPPARRGDGGAR